MDVRFRIDHTIGPNWTGNSLTCTCHAADISAELRLSAERAAIPALLLDPIGVPASASRILRAYPGLSGFVPGKLHRSATATRDTGLQ